jgi:hypothetical protein
MTKHTSGKWNWYEHDKTRVWGPIKVETATEVIAEIVWKGDDRHKERLANARLMAASPELLAACQAMYWAFQDLPDDYIHNWPDRPKALEAAKAAIQKAEGAE